MLKKATNIPSIVIDHIKLSYGLLFFIFFKLSIASVILTGRQWLPINDLPNYLRLQELIKLQSGIIDGYIFYNSIFALLSKQLDLPLYKLALGMFFVGPLIAAAVLQCFFSAIKLSKSKTNICFIFIAFYCSPLGGHSLTFFTPSTMLILFSIAVSGLSISLITNRQSHRLIKLTLMIVFSILMPITHPAGLPILLVTLIVLAPIALIKNATKATYLELSLFAIISLVSLLVPQGNLDATKLAVVKTDSAEELIQILNEAGFDADGPDTTALPIDGANVEKLTLVSSPAILEVKKDHECKLCSADGPIEIPARAYWREILENFAIFFGITLDTRFEKHKAEENALLRIYHSFFQYFFQTQ